MHVLRMSSSFYLCGHYETRLHNIGGECNKYCINGRFYGVLVAGKESHAELGVRDLSVPLESVIR